MLTFRVQKVENGFKFRKSKSAQHLKSCKLEEKQSCEKEGQKYQKKVVVIPIYSLIVKGLKKMSETERNGMQVLFEASYLNAKKGRPYSDFSDWLEWAELQGVKLSVPYKNRTQCTEFIKHIDQALFDKDVQNKLERVNFIAIFCDGNTGSAVIEKECIHIMFCDPDTFEPVLTFLSLKDLPSQDTDGIKSAIDAAFNDISMPELGKKIVLLASDGESANSGVKSGLAAKFCETGIPWLVFVWCLSHRLELALKDNLEKVMEPIKKCLTN